MKLKRYHAQSGLTLFEMLLTVLMMGGLVLLFLGMMKTEARDVLYSKNADYMNFIMDAAYALTDEINEFDTLYNNIAAQGGILEIPILNTPGVNPLNINLQNGGAGIPANSGLVGAANFSQSMPLGAPVSIIYEILDNVANPNDERNVGIYVFGTNVIPDKDIRPAAAEIGAESAYISNNSPATCLAPPVNCNGTIRSIFNAWQIDTTSLGATRLGANLTTYLAGNTRQGYLGVYRFVNESDLAGDYLYRTPQVGRPDLNAMFTDVNMNGNNLVGADDVAVIGNYSIDNPVTIHAQGSVFAGGNANVDGADIRIDGDMEAGTLNLAPDYVDTNLNIPPRNLIRVQNLLDVNDLQIDIINAQSGDFDSVLTPRLTGGNVTVGNVDATTSATGIDVSDEIETLNMQVDNRLNAPDIRVNNQLNVVNRIETNDFDVGNNLRIDGNLNTDNAQFNDIDIDELEQCLSGC